MAEGPVVIAKEDRLQAELIQARMQNVQYQLQIMQGEIQKALAERNTIIAEMGKFREEFQAKYNLDLAKIQINNDGTVQEAVPRPG